MYQDKINLLRELGSHLTPTTLAAIVADLNESTEGQFSHDMSMVLDMMTLAGEANCGDEFEQMVIEAESDRMPQ